MNMFIRMLLEITVGFSAQANANTASGTRTRSATIIDSICQLLGRQLKSLGPLGAAPGCVMAEKDIDYLAVASTIHQTNRGLL